MRNAVELGRVREQLSAGVAVRDAAAGPVFPSLIRSSQQAVPAFGQRPHVTAPAVADR